MLRDFRTALVTLFMITIAAIAPGIAAPTAFAADQDSASSGTNPAIAAATDKTYFTDKSQSWNADFVSKNGSSCSSENNNCSKICLERDSYYRQACNSDCAARINYCRITGFYPWIKGKSVRVSSRQ